MIGAGTVLTYHPKDIDHRPKRIYQLQVIIPIGICGTIVANP